MVMKRAEIEVSTVSLAGKVTRKNINLENILKIMYAFKVISTNCNHNSIFIPSYYNTED